MHKHDISKMEHWCIWGMGVGVIRSKKIKNGGGSRTRTPDSHVKVSAPHLLQHWLPPPLSLSSSPNNPLSALLPPFPSGLSEETEPAALPYHIQFGLL